MVIELKLLLSSPQMYQRTRSNKFIIIYFRLKIELMIFDIVLFSYDETIDGFLDEFSTIELFWIYDDVLYSFRFRQAIIAAVSVLKIGVCSFI
jgi:hypothetical protein